MKFPFEKIQREIVLIKKPKVHQYGCYPDDLPTEELIKQGIVLVDKPRGPTSHQVSSYVKHIFGAKAAGHSGTLDPNVTGLLPVALDDATKTLQALLVAGKEYVCYMLLHDDVDPEKIKAVLHEHVGVISQLPPIKSAVKRQIRKREIYYIELLEIEGRNVLFRVGCQAGTYIRKLCTDIGDKLGCGAHMQQLVRTRVATYKNMHTLHDIKDAYIAYKEGDDSLLKGILLHNTTTVAHLPKVWICDDAIYYITHGAQLAIPGIFKYEHPIKKGQMIAIMSAKQELVALATAQMDSQDLKSVAKGIFCKTQRVILDERIYPKITK